MITSSQIFELFRNMEEALIISDLSGLILSANAMACDLLDMNENDLKGRHIHALLTPRRKEIELREISRNKGKGPIMWLLLKQGRLNLAEEDGGMSSFMAAMTHEIRTPMNGIIGMTDLALEEETSPVLKEYLDVIKLSADSLMRVINDILDYSKIEAGRLSLEEIAIPFPRFMEDIVRIFTPQAAARGLDFHYNPEPGLPGTITGDPIRIRQIIQNILNNALKFTSSGSIELSAHLDRTSSPQRLYFYISDTGIGIPKEKQHLLFRSFTQVDSSTTRKYGGTGLGLAICAYLTALMGGEIDLKSKENKGSTFRFFLPLRKNAPEEKLEGSKEPGSGAQETSRSSDSALILLMEDNRVNQLLAVRTMEKAGYRVVTAENGREGIELFRRYSPDLILMDIQMPVMDGYETSRAIRRLESELETETPIIALTAMALAEDRQRMSDAGMNDFLGKPVSPIDLKQMLHKYCRN